MTTPPPSPGGGGSGFTHGDDFVAARLSFDIDASGVAGLREITQEVDRFRTAIEAATRGHNSFVYHLDAITEAAAKAAMATGHLTNQVGASGNASLNAPGQYVAPFSAGVAGMGEGRTVDTTQLMQQNPRGFINMNAQHGGVRRGDLPAGPPSEGQVQETAMRMHNRDIAQQQTAAANDRQYGGVSAQVANEMHAGSQAHSMSGGPRASGAVPSGGSDAQSGGLFNEALGSMMGGIAGRSGLGGLARMGMGAIGGMGAGALGIAGLGLGGLAAAQEVGGQYQAYKNMGAIRGGGAGEGMGYEMAIRTMALNPFISVEQSRAIVQQGLREGYTGKEFETVTQFVASNLKDFNMDVSQSFELMRKNVIEGGQSQAGLKASLGEIQELSKTGVRSAPELQAEYQALSAAGINAGIPGGTASTLALQAGQNFANDQSLKDVGGQVAGASLTNQTMQTQIMLHGGEGGGPLGLNQPFDPRRIPEAATEQGKDWNKATYNMLGWKVKNIYARQGVYGKESFRRDLQSLGIEAGNSASESDHLFEKLLHGENPAQGGNQREAQARENQLQIKEKSTMSRVGDTMTGAGHMAKELTGSFFDVLTGHGDNLGHRHDEFTDALGLTGNDPFSKPGPLYEMETLNAVKDAYKQEGGIEVVGPGGKAMKLDERNRAQMEKLKSGEYKWRPKGSDTDGMTLRDTPSSNAGDIKAAVGGHNKTDVSGSVTIDLTDSAKQMLKPSTNTIKLTPHEQQANQGWDKAAPNNPPPGYQYPRSPVPAGSTGY